MSLKFQDYYQTLGVAKTATQDEVQRAYRKLAKQHHPDTNKSPDAEKKIKEINEAYEVLKDPDKRQQYDLLGSDYKNGQDFRPPPGYEQSARGFGGPGGGGPGGGGPGGGGSGGGFHMEGGDFSDFFETFFGQQNKGFNSGGGGRRAPRSMKGEDVETQISISVEDAFAGSQREIALQTGDGQRKTLTVKIPPGAGDGAVIRLAGQGSPGAGGGASGDLLLKVRLAPHPRFEVSGQHLTCDVKIAPWEAALGAKIELPLFGENVTLTIPAGAQSSQKMRLRGKGLPAKNKTSEAGDLFIRILIVVPKTLTDEERDLLEKWRAITTFDPRA